MRAGRLYYEASAVLFVRALMCHGQSCTITGHAMYAGVMAVLCSTIELVCSSSGHVGEPGHRLREM